MIKNYKIDVSGSPHPELQMMGTSDTYTTWRVYFDVVEDTTKKETINVTIPKTIVETVEEVNPKTGETISYPVEKVEMVDETLENRTYNSKYIEVTRYNDGSEPNPLDLMKECMISEVEDYDTSPQVNSFLLNGISTWLSKDTRVGLMNSISIQKNSGLTTTTLWLGTTPLSIGCDDAIAMLSSLENYALSCFNKTAEHKKNIGVLEHVSDVIGYDYTAGYPDRLIINI